MGFADAVCSRQKTVLALVALCLVLHVFDAVPGLNIGLSAPPRVDSDADHRYNVVVQRRAPIRGPWQPTRSNPLELQHGLEQAQMQHSMSPSCIVDVPAFVWQPGSTHEHCETIPAVAAEHFKCMCVPSACSRRDNGMGRRLFSRACSAFTFGLTL